MDARRAELLSHIDDMNQLQKHLAIIYIALGAIAFVLFFVDGMLGALALLSLIFCAIGSFWVTAARNAANRRKLDDLVRHRDADSLRQRDVRNAPAR